MFTADDGEAVHVAGEHRYREEIHRSNGLAVIVQKGHPALHGWKAFLLGAPVSSGGRCWILCNHLEDHLADLFANCRRQNPSCIASRLRFKDLGKSGVGVKHESQEIGSHQGPIQVVH